MGGPQRQSLPQAEDMCPHHRVQWVSSFHFRQFSGAALVQRLTVGIRSLDTLLVTQVDLQFLGSNESPASAS